MAATAGQVAEAGRIPGERIATDIDTADSSTFTTAETVVQSVTASVVSGRTYRVRAVSRFGSTVSADTVTVNIREDSVSGSHVAQENCEIANSGFVVGYPAHLEGQFTASSSTNKTFVLTGQRVSGSGTIHREASATRPSLLYVEYVEG